MTVSAWIAVVAAAVALASLPLTARIANSARSQATLARRQTDLQERIHRDSAQPYVWADLQGDDAQGHLLRLIVCNQGPTVATDVQVVFDPPLQTAMQPEKLDLVQERLRAGLRSLAPGRRLQWTVDIAHQIFSRGAPLIYTVRIDGNGPFGKLVPVQYVIDLGDLRNSADAPFGSLHEVKKSIVELTKSLQANR